MKCLVVSDYGVKISIRKGILTITSRGGRRVEANLVDLQQILVLTGGVVITSRAIRCLMEHGVDVVFVNHRGLPIGRIYPPYINRTVNTRRMQYEAYLNGKGLNIAKSIAEAKIRNQAGLLRRFARSTGDTELRKCARRILAELKDLREVRGPLKEARKTILSIEGRAARMYWSAVSSLLPGEMGFEYRDKDGFDPFNTMLNYGYGILYSESWKALVLAGLDPYAGYLHTDRSGKPTLSFDYVEMFRCSLVDHTLIKMARKGWRPKMENGLLIASSRGEIAKEIIGALDRKARCSGETMTLSRALKKYAFKLASYIRGDTREYKGFVEEW